MRQTPSFGSDPTRVHGYTTDAAQEVYRVFIPVELPGGGYESWEEICRRLNIPFSSNTRWSQIRHRANCQEQELGVPAYGMVARSFVEALLSAWPAPPKTPMRFAFWVGYAEPVADALDQEGVQLLPATQEDFLHNGEFSIHRDSAKFLLRLTSDETRHFPSAVWTEDHSTILAGPIYADSFILTCTPETHQTMISSGIEVLPIDRNCRMPIEGA